MYFHGVLNCPTKEAPLTNSSQMPGEINIFLYFFHSSSKDKKLSTYQYTKSLYS